MKDKLPINFPTNEVAPVVETSERTHVDHEAERRGIMDNDHEARYLPEGILKSGDDPVVYQPIVGHQGYPGPGRPGVKN